MAECQGNHDQAMSCVEGTIWDAETAACVPLVIG